MCILHARLPWANTIILDKNLMFRPIPPIEPTHNSRRITIQMLDRLLSATLAAVLTFSLASCDSTSSTSTSGNPTFSGPRPSVSGSSARPVSHLPSTEYPFDAKGNYITSWAAAGDKKYGARRASSSSSRSSSSRSSSTRSKRASTPRYRTHTVKKGDTLWGLSKRYGKSVSSIKSASGLRSDSIRIGQRLKIPR